MMVGLDYIANALTNYALRANRVDTYL